MNRRIIVRNDEGETLYAGETEEGRNSIKWRDFLSSPPNIGDLYRVTYMEIDESGELYITEYLGEIDSKGVVLRGSDCISLDTERLNQLEELLESSKPTKEAEKEAQNSN